MGGGPKGRQAAMDHEHDGRQLERLTFFSDAVFAIAMTLLVIEVRLPVLHDVSEARLGQALLDLIPNYIGFIVSFIVIGRFWAAHHLVFGLLRATSQRLVWTNLFFLLTIAFMPFPTAVFSEYVGYRVAIGFYAGWLIVIGLFNRAVGIAALRDPRLVRHDVAEAVFTNHVRHTWIPILIGGAAFAGGMVAPLFGLVALMAGSPVIGWLIRRRDVKPAS